MRVRPPPPAPIPQAVTPTTRRQARIRVGLNDPEELIAADPDHISRGRRADRHHCVLARERADLAGELAPRQSHQDLFRRLRPRGYEGDDATSGVEAMTQRDPTSVAT